MQDVPSQRGNLGSATISVRFIPRTGGPAEVRVKASDWTDVKQMPAGDYAWDLGFDGGSRRARQQASRRLRRQMIAAGLKRKR